MKPRLSKREQRILAVVLVLGAGILWMYVVCIVQPLLGEVRELGQQLRAAREELKILEVSAANESALRQQHGKVQEAVASLRKLLPSEEELPQVIELLSDLAGQSQVKIQTIFPQRPAAPNPADLAKSERASAEAYKGVIIQVDALSGFHQLGMFLSLVESGEKPMQVSSLRISADEKEPRRQRVKLLLKTYLAARDAAHLAERAF
jgi:Tfp pilus assembly protein PilO